MTIQVTDISMMHASMMWGLWVTHKRFLRFEQKGQGVSKENLGCYHYRPVCHITKFREDNEKPCI